MTAQTASRFSQSTTTPAGGYCLFPLTWLYGVWWSYRRGYLEFQDVRAYFALHEMVARRCTITTGRSPRYTVEELQRLTGLNTPRSSGESLRRLQRLGWVLWGSSEIVFLEGHSLFAGEVRDSWEADVARIANRRRRVPVPRRTLRFLCRVEQPVMVATALAHLFRCLYAKGRVMAAEGSVAASWVADVFEADIRSVKRSRAKLRDMEWLSARRCDHWHRQRYGQRVAINLAWNPQTADPVSVQKPPRSSESSTPLSPPDSNRKLPNGIKNQKPATPGRLGVQKPPASLPPKLRNVQSKDLDDTGRLLELFTQAKKAKLIGASDHERLQFATAAVRAKSRATLNPGGFFARLVRGRLWHHATAEEESLAHAMLKRYLDPPEIRHAAPHSSPTAVPITDIRLVAMLTNELKKHGFSGDPFPLLAERDGRWSRERWNRAMRCWLTPATNRESVCLQTG